MAKCPTHLLAELTHRCQLHCPFCSNPVEMARADQELTTEEWKRVFTEARELGVLQLGLSGGEPLIRKDLEKLVAHGHEIGLYTTLLTSGLGYTRARALRLKEAGLDHVQISFHDVDSDAAERMVGLSVPEKLQAAALVRELDLAFTINVVLHRENLDRLEAIIDMAAELGAERLELANTQYYGWARANQAALLPTQPQLETAQEVAQHATARYRGRMQIIYVVSDYYAPYPKPCYGGWGNVYIVVTPDGRALPCHGAAEIPTLAFENVRQRRLAWIWDESPGFNQFRGDAWMKEPCRSCARRSLDFGGCRCQAFALTGDAANPDPVCTLTPFRAIVDEVLSQRSDTIAYRYRNIRRASVTP